MKNEIGKERVKSALSFHPQLPQLIDAIAVCDVSITTCHFTSYSVISKLNSGTSVIAAIIHIGELKQMPKNWGKKKVKSMSCLVCPF